MPLAATDVGSLTFYRTAAAPFDQRSRNDAALLAEVAALALLADVDALNDDAEPVDTDGYHGVQIAAGVLSVRLGVSVAEALVHIHAHAYGSGRTLAETAQAVMEGSSLQA